MNQIAIFALLALAWTIQCPCVGQDTGAIAPVSLSLQSADENTATIQAAIQEQGSAVIPKGSWPIRPIELSSHSELRGIVENQVNQSRLFLAIDSPRRYDPQHVIATRAQENTGGFTKQIRIRDLIIDGNYQAIDWKHVYGDGNGFGIFLRGAANCEIKNVEIRNCWTDGIYVATVLGHANNTRDCSFENLYIHHCGRQAVSVVGGEKLTFHKFKIRSIGRDAPLATSPRAAIDLEPEANVKRLVRDITIRDWDIARTGQGVLISGAHSVQPAENIVVEKIKMRDLDGPQILSVRDARNVTIRKVQATNHHPRNGGVGIIFRNAKAAATEMDFRQLTGTNFPLRIDGSSDVTLKHVRIEGCERGVLQIGNERELPIEGPQVRISDFLFTNVAQAKTGLPIMRIHSLEEAMFVRGEISQPGMATFTAQLFSNARFQACELHPGQFGTFDPSQPGKAMGYKNP